MIDALTFTGSWTPPVSSEAIKLFLGDKSGYAGRFRILFGVIDTYKENVLKTERQTEVSSQSLTSSLVRFSGTVKYNLNTMLASASVNIWYQFIKAVQQLPAGITTTIPIEVSQICHKHHVLHVSAFFLSTTRH